MTKKEIKQRIEKLKKEINYHRYLYHVLDKQEISEGALDSLKHELYLLEQQNPEFITKDSPTQRVEGKPLDKFKKVSHKVRMMSLEDVFSISEFEKWSERIKKVYPSGKYEYFGELKVDGFAISLIYEKGILSVASTRGDGFVGEDVTQNIKTIESVPLGLSIHKKDAKDEDYLKNIEKIIQKESFEIRGEVYMSKKTFEKINKEREKMGEPKYANPRNTAAGSIRQLDPSVAASRKLEFLAYSIVTDFGQKTHKEEHDLLDILGFKTDKYAKILKDVNDVSEFYEQISKKRDKLSYQIDGLVVSVNDNATFKKLGIVGKAPRGAVAFKFPAEEATTKIEDIRIQVGRTGVLTPVAYLAPVLIGGTTVSRASLHNKDEIERLGVKIGDTVVVQRAGDVIPKIISVFKNLRDGSEKSFKMPKKCPVCHEPVLKDKDGVLFRCVNKKCPAKNKESIFHFVSKKAFDIDGLGAKILDQLLKEGFISDFSDIFTLVEGDLIPLERFAEKSAKNLINAIKEKKEISLERFIYALGILHVGEETAIDLAKYISAKNKIQNPKDFLEAFLKEDKESLQKIKDIGPKVAESIVSYFKDKHHQSVLQKLNDVGIIIKAPKTGLQKGIFSDKIFVLTGELENFTRDQAKEKIREMGGSVSSSVSKKTDFLLFGKNPGSKFQKAKKLNIPLLSEKEFINMLEK